MKITKFSHACFVAEVNNTSIVVDPGNWTTDFKIPANVTAVFISHQHQDHLNKDIVDAICKKNPDAVVLAHESVISILDNLNTQSIASGQTLKIGEVTLEFFGGHHAVITRGLPILPNLGIMINNQVYYPGDSFAVPEKPVEILALPISAPWLKFNEVVDFFLTVRPKLVFPTHDAILSDAGKDLLDTMLQPIVTKTGAEYHRLPIGSSVEF